MGEEVERGKPKGKAAFEINSHAILSFRGHTSKKVSVLVGRGTNRVPIAKELLARV